MDQGSFFAYGYLLAPAPFVTKTVLFPLHYLVIQLIVYLLICFWTLLCHFDLCVCPYANASATLS